MMRKYYNIMTAVATTLTPILVLAQGTNGGLNIFGERTHLGANLDVIQSIAAIINAFLGFIGVIFVVIIIVAGFQWMTSGGNDEKTAAAKKTIGSGIIGLVIILSAYAIAQFIIGNLIVETGANL